MFFTELNPEGIKDLRLWIAKPQSIRCLSAMERDETQEGDVPQTHDHDSTISWHLFPHRQFGQVAASGVLVREVASLPAL